MRLQRVFLAFKSRFISVLVAWKTSFFFLRVLNFLRSFIFIQFRSRARSNIEWLWIILNDNELRRMRMKMKSARIYVNDPSITLISNGEEVSFFYFLPFLLILDSFLIWLLYPRHHHIFGFISIHSHLPTSKNFKSGKIQNDPRHKIYFITSGLLIFTDRKPNFNI